jgi:hypothetical protein
MEKLEIFFGLDRFTTLSQPGSDNMEKVPKTVENLNIELNGISHEK